MKKAALLLALCPVAAFSQPAKPSNNQVVKLVRLRYVQPSAVRELVNPAGQFVTFNNALKAVVVSGPPETVATIEKLIQQIDVPPSEAQARDVEISVYLIGATSKPAPEAAAVPQSLEPVVRQLKAIFPYSTYVFLDSTLIRTRERSPASTSGIFKDFLPQDSQPASEPMRYTVGYSLPGNDPATRAIHLSEFQIEVNGKAIRARLQTDVDLPEGQKVVVGKTDIDGGDAALFVVLSAGIE